jgi:hypothetical protein
MGKNTLGCIGIFISIGTQFVDHRVALTWRIPPRWQHRATGDRQIVRTPVVNRLGLSVFCVKNARGEKHDNWF